MPKKGEKRAARKKEKARAKAEFEKMWGTAAVDLTETPTPPKPATVHALVPSHPTVKEALTFINPKVAQTKAKKRAKKKKKKKQRL